MKSFIIASIVLTAACGTTPDIGPETSEITSNLATHTIQNGNLTLPSSAGATGQWCLAVQYGAAGGHSQAAMSGDVATSGAAFQSAQPSTFALPNYKTFQNPAGAAVIEMMCLPWSRFGGGTLSTAVSLVPFGGQFAWSTASANLDTYQNNFCFLNSITSMGNANEVTMLGIPANNWQLTTAGFGDNPASARCARFGRPINYTQLVEITPLETAKWSQQSVTGGVCAIVEVRGNLDDGNIWITDVGGVYVLNRYGAVTGGKMLCMNNL